MSLIASGPGRAGDVLGATRDGVYGTPIGALDASMERELRPIFERLEASVDRDLANRLTTTWGAAPDRNRAVAVPTTLIDPVQSVAGLGEGGSWSDEPRCGAPRES